MPEDNYNPNRCAIRKGLIRKYSTGFDTVGVGKRPQESSNHRKCDRCYKPCGEPIFLCHKERRVVLEKSQRTKPNNQIDALDNGQESGYTAKVK